MWRSCQFDSKNYCQISSFAEKKVFLSKEFRTVGGQITCIFDVSAASIGRIQCILGVVLKFIIMNWVSSSRHLVTYLISFRLWQVNMLFSVGFINFRIFFLNILKLGAFWISEYSLFNSLITYRKKDNFEEITFDFEMRNVACVRRRLWSVKLKNQIRKIIWRSAFQNFMKVAYISTTSLLQWLQA